MRRSRLVCATSIAVVLTSLATACGDSGPTVTVYSGRGERLVGQILDDFEDETGINLEVNYGQSADLALLLEEEMAAGGSDVDVFLSQSPGAMGVLDQAGRLDQLPQETLDLVPAGVRDSDGRWVGFSGRQRVLVYNEGLVQESELPGSVFDLTDPEWNGRLGVAPSNGSFQDFVTTMRATEGDDVTMEWLEGIAANDPVTFPNNNSIVAAVGRGEVDAGLVNHYYNFRFLDEDPSHAGRNHLFEPDDPGSVLIVTAAGVIEGTDVPDEAVQLINFLLASEGQQYFAEETFEYPLATGEQPAGGVPVVEFDDVSGIRYEDLGGGLEATREMIAAAGLEG